MDTLTRLIIFKKAEKYLQDNPERFNDDEKKIFRLQLDDYLSSPNQRSIDDNVYDFFVNCDITKDQNRHILFAKYLIKKYSPSTHPNLLDVGAGRMCHLSTRLARNNFNVSAIDPKIRLSESEAQQRKINRIITNNFYCDDYAPKHSAGTDITPYDLIVGLEPCDATEHIIRQCLKENKPFDISLCTTHHTALDGKRIRTQDEWYEYLQSISNEVKIKKVPGMYIASNNM